MQRNKDQESPFMQKLWDTGGLMTAWLNRDKILQADSEESVDQSDSDESVAPSDQSEAPTPEVKKVCRCSYGRPLST